MPGLRSPRSRRFRHVLFGFALLAGGLLGGVYYRGHNRPATAGFSTDPVAAPLLSFFEPDITRIKVTNPLAAKIVKAAHEQEGDVYTSKYVRISYPGGDVPAGSGACTDVVIRSLRAAGYDLQQLIHQDMARHFSAYPNKWHRDHTDPNIDHRRVPNHMTFFSRHGTVLPLEVNSSTLNTWQPGDIVCWKLDGGRWHTGIISDGLDASGIPLVIHNGLVCIEQDSLLSWEIVGHYRFPRKSV